MECRSDESLWSLPLSSEMAQALLKEGYSSFRFDLGGRGDSKIRDDIAEDFERSVNDALEALEFIKSNFAYDSFIIYGHCTSAVEDIS